MKKLFALLVALMMLSLTFFGCAAPAAETPSAPEAPAESPAEAPAESPAEAPAEEPSNEDLPDRVPSDESWNDMTDEELYELAKAEGGTINVYAISSRMQKTCEKFNEAYPGLNAVAYDLDQDEAVSKIEIEAQTGNVNADVFQGKDTAGEIYFDFYPLGYVEAYYPTDIVSHIDPALLKFGMPFYSSLNFWYYNTEQFPDGCPITNWWDIVELDENGQQKYNIITKEIAAETTYLALFTSFVVHADEMAAAYEEKYGKPIEYTYDASVLGNVENNAGYEYIYQFTQLKMTFINDGDEVVAAVHNATTPTLGFVSGGKISNKEENGYNIDWATNLAPYTAVQNTNYLYMIQGCDNPAGGRLFIRFLMGGADGQSGGFDPFTKQGNWSIRDDYTSPNNPFPISESGAIVTDLKTIYDEIYNVQDFWKYWLDQNPNM